MKISHFSMGIMIAHFFIELFCGENLLFNTQCRLNFADNSMNINVIHAVLVHTVFEKEQQVIPE